MLTCGSALWPRGYIRDADAPRAKGPHSPRPSGPMSAPRHRISTNRASRPSAEGTATSVRPRGGQLWTTAAGSFRQLLFEILDLELVLLGLRGARGVLRWRVYSE